jgi:tellurite resistance protein
MQNLTSRWGPHRALKRAAVSAILAPMDSEEMRACARVLLAVATADGRVQPDERRLVELAGGDAHVGPVDVEAELSKVRSPAARERTLRSAIAVAGIDGHCTPNELKLLELIHARLGGPTALSLRAMRHEARESIDQAREALEEATVAFLHAVGSKGETLGQKEYEALVAELERKKREILSTALPPNG